jgi:hypothetical protein
MEITRNLEDGDYNKGVALALEIRNPEKGIHAEVKGCIESQTHWLRVIVSDYRNTDLNVLAARIELSLS